MERCEKRKDDDSVRGLANGRTGWVPSHREVPEYGAQVLLSNGFVSLRTWLRVMRGQRGGQDSDTTACLPTEFVCGDCCAGAEWQNDYQIYAAIRKTHSTVSSPSVCPPHPYQAKILEAGQRSCRIFKNSNLSKHSTYTWRSKMLFDTAGAGKCQVSLAAIPASYSHQDSTS